MRYRSEITTNDRSHKQGLIEEAAELIATQAPPSRLIMLLEAAIQEPKAMTREYPNAVLV